MIWIAAHLLGLLFLVGILIGSGTALRRLAWRPDGRFIDASLSPLVDLILGLTTWSVLLWSLAALQLLHSGPLLAGAGLAVLAWILSRRHRTLDPEPPSAEARRLTPMHRVFLGLLGLLVLSPIAVLAMVPTVSWDASSYHLTVPRLYLEHGGFRPIELNVYSNWPLGTEMLFGLAMQLYDFVLAKLLHFAFGLAVLYTMWIGLHDSGQDLRGDGLSNDDLTPSQRSSAGLLAMVLFLANGVVLFEMRVAYVDLAHALYLTTAFVFLQRWQRQPERFGLLVLGGLSCGLMAAGKLNGFVGAVALGWLLIPGLRRLAEQRGRIVSARYALLGFATPMAALWGPWLAKSAWFTGNPVYPLLHHVFGGPDWGPELTSQLGAWQSSIGMGREPLDFLLLPWRLITQGGSGYDRFDGELGLLWLLAIPIALWRARLSQPVRQFLLAGTTFFVLWAMTSQQMRLLIPALPLLAMAGGQGLMELVAQRTDVISRRLAGGLLAAGLVYLVASQYALLGNGWNAARRMQATPATQIVRSARPPIFDAVDALPADARLLMLNTNQGFFCRRDYLADSFFEASQTSHWLRSADSPSAVHQALRDRHVSHVLLDRQPRPVTYPESLMTLLRTPSLAAVTAQSPDGRFLLFALQ